MTDFLKIFIGGFLSSSLVLALVVFVFKESFKRILDKELEKFKLELNTMATARNLSSAFAGEISALLNIIEKRSLVALINNAIVQTKEGTVTFPDFSVKGNYFNVYYSSISNLGLLPAPLPGQIATFYTYLMSVVEDLNWMTEVDKSKITKEKALAEMIPLIETLTEAICRGKDIIKQIKSFPITAIDN